MSRWGNGKRCTSNPGMIQFQPGFCAICGADFERHSSLGAHLNVAHREVSGRTRLQAYRIAWREVSCALLEITRPSWNDPLVEGA